MSAIFMTKEFWTVAGTLLSIAAAVFWYYWNKKHKLEEAEQARLEDFAKKKISSTKSIQAEQPRINESIRNQNESADHFEFPEGSWGDKHEQ